MSQYLKEELLEITDKLEDATVKLHVRLSASNGYKDKKVVMKSIAVIQERRETIMTYINRLNSHLPLTPDMNNYVAEIYSTFLPILERTLANDKDPFSND